MDVWSAMHDYQLRGPRWIPDWGRGLRRFRMRPDAAQWRFAPRRSPNASIRPEGSHESASTRHPPH
jgi:hypothetical protein